MAYVQDRWRVFDPTPPEGRPGFLEAGSSFSLSQAWDRFEAQWDRWVLTFSLSDQAGLVQAVAEAAARLRPALAKGVPAAILAVVLLVLVRLWRRMPAGPVKPSTRMPRITRALTVVVARAARGGVPIVPGTTAREFSRRASAAFPSVAGPLEWLVGEHERCRYAGESPPARGALRRAVRAIEAAIASR